MPQNIQITKYDGIIEVKLNKPKVNAIDHEMSRELANAFSELRDSDDLKVGIITAEGHKIFSAGWDLKALNKGEIKLDNWWEDGDYGDGGFAGLTENWTLNKPVIAALNGLVIGGGFEIAMSCDLLIASDHVEFGLPEMFDRVYGETRIGVFGLITKTVATSGFEMFSRLGLYMLTIFAGLSIHILIVLPLIFFLFTRINPIYHFKAMASAMATAGITPA